MKKLSKTKLYLSRATVRSLAPAALASVAGGGAHTTTVLGSDQNLNVTGGCQGSGHVGCNTTPTIVTVLPTIRG